MKATLITTVCVLALAGIGGHLALRGESAHVEPAGPKAPYADPVSANGVVEGARPEVAVRPEVAGTLAVLHVRENQDVQRGTLLAELRNETQQEQVALAEAEVGVARAQLDRLRNGERAEKREAVAAVETAKRAVLEQAKAECDRSRRLMDNHSASREQYDGDHYRMLRAQADWQQAQAEHALVEAPARADEVAAATAHLAAAEARLRLARAELAKTVLRAPSDGRVLQVFTEPGEMAGPTSAQPILLLADLSRRRVRAFVEELDAARVQAGQHAVVTADGLPGKEFAGRVSVVVPRMGKRTAQSDAPGEYKDLYFREVLIDLEAGGELPLNLRVLTRIAANP